MYLKYISLKDKHSPHACANCAVMKRIFLEVSRYLLDWVFQTALVKVVWLLNVWSKQNLLEYSV